MRESDLVLRFVRSIGRPAEAEYYLSQYRSEERERFAIIAVADTIMREAVEALTVDLRLLARLDLTPVIVFGLVNPARAREYAEQICQRLHPGTDCTIATPEDAAQIARAGGIALVPTPTDLPDIDARFEALTRLAGSLQTHKVVFLGRRSGLQPRDAEVPSLVDLSTEYDELVVPGVLPDKQAALLAQVRRLIDDSAHRLTVAITSPLDLLRELFTVRGAGTLVRRGSTVARYDSYDQLDRPRLHALIENAFGARLDPAFWGRQPAAVYIADDYRGAAILMQTELAPCLTKFAVDAGARGEGIGRDLWRAMDRECPRLFWRGRPDNPIGPWYQNICHGFFRDARWHVYWRGLEPGEIEAAVRLARSAPVDLLRDQS